MGDTIMNREEILTAGKVNSITRYIESLGRDCIFQEPSAYDETSLMLTCYKVDEDTKKPKLVDGKYYAAEKIVRSMVDDDGNRIFSDGDAGYVGGMKADIVNELFEACKEVSTDEETAEKNSEALPTE
jgi:hypothetical protein